MDESGITQLGQAIARLPVHPRCARRADRRAIALGRVRPRRTDRGIIVGARSIYAGAGCRNLLGVR